jgi:hypothetical protein
MNDAVGLLASAIGLILVPICLVRLVLGRADLAALYRAPGDAWPQGVQEEDGPRWRLDRVRPVAPAARAACRGLDADVAAQIVACTAADVAALDPASPRPARGELVWPRAAVRGRLGLAGNAEIRA